MDKFDPNVFVMSSQDGMQWSAITTAPSDAWTGITWCPELGIFVVVANTGTVMVSSTSVTCSTANLPLGSIVAWHKSFSGTPSLPPGFVECNGQTLSDTGSPYDGLEIPDLNNFGDETGHAQRFLRGSTSSGTLDGSDTHTHSGSLGDPSPNSGVCNSGGSLCVAGLTHTHGVTIADASTLPSYFEVVWIMRVK